MLGKNTVLIVLHLRFQLHARILKNEVTIVRNLSSVSSVCCERWMDLFRVSPTFYEIFYLPDRRRKQRKRL